MAIENLTTVEGLQLASDTGNKIIDSLYDALEMVTGTSSQIEAVKRQLNDYISGLEDEEKNLLSKFGISCSQVADGEKELQQKFSNFYNRSGLINFTGPQLEKLILDDYRAGILTKNAEITRYIKNVIQPAMAQISIKEGTELYRIEAAKAFNDVINGMIAKVKESGTQVDFKGKVSSKRGISTEGNIYASRITKAQIERIEFLMKQSGFTSKTKPKVSTTISNNSIITQVNFNWYDITKGMTATEASKLDVRELNQMNERIVDLIVSNVNSHYGDLIRSYLNRMIYAEPYMFFVGKNVNAITGLLGEMSALIAISELLGSSYRHKIVQWVAQEKSGGKQLSIDILLKDIAGIQVKNTSKNFSELPELRIDFAEGSGREILYKLEQAYGIQLTDLEEVFESDGFNVPAAARGGKYKEVGIDYAFKHGAEPKDWQDFLKAYDAMKKTIEKAETFMTAFAPDFLYMSGGTVFQNQLANLSDAISGAINGAGMMRANDLYIVGGMPFFASTMLKEIEDNLTKLTTLQEKARVFDLHGTMTAYIKGEKVSYNYVAYKNAHDGEDAQNIRMRLTSSYGYKHPQ